MNRTIMKSRHAVFAGALLLGAVAAKAETSGANDANSTAATASEAQTAQNALSYLHHVNQMEVEAGRLAQQKGQTEEVRKYGERLVADHQKADEKVQALAEKQSLALAEPIAKTDDEKKRMDRDMAAMDRVKSAAAADFDRAFLQAMVDGHRNAILTLSSAQTQLSSEAPRKLIADVLPVIKAHEKAASELLEKQKSPSPRS